MLFYLQWIRKKKKKSSSQQCLKGKTQVFTVQSLAENKSSSLKRLVVIQSRIKSISTKGITNTSVSLKNTASTVPNYIVLKYHFCCSHLNTTYIPLLLHPTRFLQASRIPPAFAFCHLPKLLGTKKKYALTN